jgi:glutamine amidotransferase-like uncharacterized protein
MTSKIFVLTGRSINSESVINSLSRLKDREKKSPYDFDIVAATGENLIDVLQDKDVVAGILPGCDSSQNIRDQIKTTGLKALRHFVTEQGGALAGFCAGGYLMGNEINYGACFVETAQRSSKDNLELIDADFYGPLSHLVLDYAYKHPTKPYISLAHINTKDRQNLPIAYWHGGVALLPENQTELRPLATFPQPILINTHGNVCETIAPIAVGVKDFPNGGKAISSAVHPEAYGDDLDRHTRHMRRQKKNTHYRDLHESYTATVQVLKQHDDGVYSLFKDIVDEMLDSGKARKQANKTLETTALTR